MKMVYSVLRKCDFGWWRWGGDCGGRWDLGGFDLPTSFRLNLDAFFSRMTLEIKREVEEHSIEHYNAD